MKIRYLLVATGMLIGLSLIATGITGGRMTLAEAADIYHGKKSISDVFSSKTDEKLWTYHQDPNFSNTQLHCQKARVILEFVGYGLIGINPEKPIRPQFNVDALSKSAADSIAEYYYIRVSRTDKKPYIRIKDIKKDCPRHLIALGDSLNKLLAGKTEAQLSENINKFYLPKASEEIGLPRFEFIYNEHGLLIDFAIRSKEQMIEGLRTRV